ncbi:hypothetical protein LOD99_13606 [Oopsacas minuta]|uniref:CAP-Gly domain-containing protein n=1 Tax=Oopsacas minuta TaxID=111878 RepID=A0AAV7KHP4_9METZ|nr:hypothetical protein LOD99_13606 [Oopsacas minuta]
MQQSMVGSLRGTIQSVNLVWRKEKATLERTLQYFDESGATVVLGWNSKRALYEGTAELSIGRHNGSLFISDQANVDTTRTFEVDKQNIGVVQEILLLIDSNPVPRVAPIDIPTPVPIDASMSPVVDITPGLVDEVPALGPGPKENPLPFQSGVDYQAELAIAQTYLLRAKQENMRLFSENKDFKITCDRMRDEKQLIKDESYELDGHLITALEKLSYYEQQQGLMDERFKSLARETRIMQEDNKEMKFKLNTMDIQAARDHENIKQMELDLGHNNENFQKICEQRDTLMAKCSALEQNHKSIEKQELSKIQELERLKEKERLEKETDIFREEREKLRDKDIPSLLQDNAELKQELANSRQRFQEEIQLTRQERDSAQNEIRRLQGNLNIEGKKQIDQMENEGRDTILQMDQLSIHFEECGQNLKKLIQLLEANIEAKENQLDRRSQELRDARKRNDHLVQEVVSRGHEISTLTTTLQSIMSNNNQMTSRENIDGIENIEPQAAAEFLSPELDTIPKVDDAVLTKKMILPSPADLIKYQPGIKTMYQDLENVTNKVIDFSDNPLQVLKMNYLEDPKTHIGNQVICMLHGVYLIGILKVVFQYRPSFSGLGALSPISYAGIDFNQPAGQSNGAFKGVKYFNTSDKYAEFIDLENVYIHV